MNKDKRPKIVFMEAQSLGDDMDLSVRRIRLDELI